MKTAMILAAGRGERLRPLTWDKPKCLSQINGIPLLSYHLHQLIKSGFTRIVINHAYLGGLIRQYIATQTSSNIAILFSPEPAGGLETGGGIRQALPLLGNEPFLVVNADIITTFNYTDLPIVSSEQPHIVLVNKREETAHGDFGLSKSGFVTNTPKQYTFAGIACYHPALFQNQPIGRYSVTPLLRKLADKQRLTAQLFDGKWIDIGSLQGLKSAQKMFFNSDPSKNLKNHQGHSLI